MRALSANLRWLFLEWPFLERVDVAARAGFRAVDFSLPYDTPAPRLRERLDANGLSFVYMLTPAGRWDAGEMGLAALPGREAEFRHGVRVAIEYADAVGAPLLHPAAGIVPPGTDLARCSHLYLENLAFAADAAAQAGLLVGIEPVCSASHPEFFLRSTDHALNVLAQLRRPNLRLILDTHHHAMEHGAITPVIDAYVAQIGHFQVANPPHRGPPGHGELDFDFLFDRLLATGYTGWVSAEYRPPGPTLDSLDWARRFGVTPERARSVPAVTAGGTPR